MAVSTEDVRNVALLARLAIDDARLPALVQELNGILGHMDALQAVVLADALVNETAPIGMPLRPDGLAPVSLARPRDAFAPAFRDGFFLVPRLATHGDTAAGGISKAGAGDVDDTSDDE
jgi:aspartyl-tRNA(Asn)/glutamyl-tRNA(Gln) amidotransferase subunit C